MAFNDGLNEILKINVVFQGFDISLRSTVFIGGAFTAPPTPQPLKFEKIIINARSLWGLRRSGTENRVSVFSDALLK